MFIYPFQAQVGTSALLFLVLVPNQSLTLSSIIYPPHPASLCNQSSMVPFLLSHPYDFLPQKPS